MRRTSDGTSSARYVCVRAQISHRPPRYTVSLDANPELFAPAAHCCCDPLCFLRVLFYFRYPRVPPKMGFACVVFFSHCCLYNPKMSLSRAAVHHAANR